MSLEDKQKTMEDQFADLDDGIDTHDIDSTSACTVKTDGLERYLRMNIEEIYRQPNPLPFWRI